MRKRLIGSTKHIFFALFYALIGIVFASLSIAIWGLNAKPDLSLWHKIELTHQYRGQADVDSLDAYLALESSLFEELEQRIYNTYQPTVSSPINRFETGSLSDPNQWSVNWNRTFNWPKANPDFGILLLHGMSDSPYAMQHIGHSFKQLNASVVGLRLPGHGTIPAALTRLRWQEMAKAVELATEHLQAQLNGKPLYVVGFSTGAALALNHELERIHRGQQGAYQKMVFISPAIGLPAIAAGAYWQAKLGQLLGLEKLAWNSVHTEYDPFKYLSFAVNAGDVVYSLTQRNQALTASLSAEQLLALPPILTFQSVTDDTVSTAAILNRLYHYLPNRQHQLVLFDVNRTATNKSLMNLEPLAELASIGIKMNTHFKAELVENLAQRTEQVHVREVSEQPTANNMLLDNVWPQGVYSLSHVALPFPEHDPLYGPHSQAGYDGIKIGQAIFQGERGIFTVPAADMLRQKWNPFYPFMEQRIHEFFEQ